MKFALISLTCLCLFGQSAAKEKEFSDVTINQSTEDDPTAFVNILLDTLVKKSIVDESTASQILVTFKVKGVERNPQAAKAFTKATIGAATIKGDADASSKFIKRLTKLLDQRADQGRQLIEHLLELVLDNDLLEAQTAAELAATNGYGVKIETTRVSINTQQVQVTPAPAKPKGACCCAKNLSPLFELGLTNSSGAIISSQHRMYQADMQQLYGIINNHCNSEGVPCRRALQRAVAQVATSPKSCDCNGAKLEPMYRSGKHMGGHNYDLRHGKLADAKKLTTESGFYDDFIPKFYCATTRGQCGATEPLRSFFLADKTQYLTIDPEEGKKHVAAGAKDEGILCYAWPHAVVG